MLPRLFIAGLISGRNLCSTRALSSEKRNRADKTSTDTRLNMPATEWIAKLFVIAILYVFIYFTFRLFCRVEERGGARLLRR